MWTEQHMNIVLKYIYKKKSENPDNMRHNYMNMPNLGMCVWKFV